MLKHLKLVGTLLFLSSICGETVYAALAKESDMEVVQQSGKCTGVVKDKTGETIIGASVVVKGTTNGSVTGMNGEFSLNNVPRGSVIVVSFVGFPGSGSEVDRRFTERYVERRRESTG